MLKPCLNYQPHTKACSTDCLTLRAGFVVETGHSQFIKYVVLPTVTNIVCGGNKVCKVTFLLKNPCCSHIEYHCSVSIFSFILTYEVIQAFQSNTYQSHTSTGTHYNQQKSLFVATQIYRRQLTPKKCIVVSK